MPKITVAPFPSLACKLLIYNGKYETYALDSPKRSNVLKPIKSSFILDCEYTRYIVTLNSEYGAAIIVGICTAGSLFIIIQVSTSFIFYYYIFYTKSRGFLHFLYQKPRLLMFLISKAAAFYGGPIVPNSCNISIINTVDIFYDMFYGLITAQTLLTSKRNHLIKLSSYHMEFMVLFPI